MKRSVWKNIKKVLKSNFFNWGYEIRRIREPKEILIDPLLKIMQLENIDTVFDIGANRGQFGLYLRKSGYLKTIISFEPLNTAFIALEKQSSEDDLWFAVNYALGEFNDETYINIANNSYSSSILKMLPKHIEAAPYAKFISKQKVTVKTLDSVFKDFTNKNSKVMLKIDTQGYEKFILNGGSKSISDIAIIQLEMSLIPLYLNETLFTNMIDYMEEMGFTIFSLDKEFEDPVTGQLLQINGTFVNKNGKK